MRNDSPVFQRFREHKRDEDNINTNSLHARPFIQEGHKFIAPVEIAKYNLCVERVKENCINENIENKI